MSIEESIKDIKKELRASMNGVASKYMRENGLDYHVNFGIELPRLREIAGEFEPNHQLAQQLWNENVRESKLLAAMLMPIDSFYPEIADIWVDEITTTEVAQMTSMNLFSRLPYASTKAFEWIASDSETRQLCGYLILVRLLKHGATLNEHSRNELKDQLESVPETAPLALRKIVLTMRNIID